MALLRAEEEAKVREWFAEVERPVELLVAIGPEETPRTGAGDVDFGAEMVHVCEGLAELGEGVTCRIEQEPEGFPRFPAVSIDRKSTRLNSSHGYISYAVFCLKKKKIQRRNCDIRI